MSNIKFVKNYGVLGNRFDRFAYVKEGIILQTIDVLVRQKDETFQLLRTDARRIAEGRVTHHA